MEPIRLIFSAPSLADGFPLRLVFGEVDDDVPLPPDVTVTLQAHITAWAAPSMPTMRATRHAPSWPR